MASGTIAIQLGPTSFPLVFTACGTLKLSVGPELDGDRLLRPEGTHFGVQRLNLRGQVPPCQFHRHRSMRLERIQVGREGHVDVDLEDGAGKRVGQFDELPRRDLRFRSRKVNSKIRISLELHPLAARNKRRLLSRVLSPLGTRELPRTAPRLGAFVGPTGFAGCEFGRHSDSAGHR